MSARTVVSLVSRRWRRSRSSARAARCSPATCSATSSATRSSPARRSRCSTSTPSGSATSELVARRVAEALGCAGEDHRDDRSARRARRRRLRDQHDPGRRLRAVHRHRLRGAEAVRAAPDDRRHARHRRDHARAAHDPGAARHVRRHGRAVPRRVVPQLHEPDGDQLPRRHPGDAASARSGCATACRAPRSSCRIDLGIPYREIDYLAAGINHMAFYLRFERDGEDLYPRLQELADVGRGARRQPRALRGAEALRLLRHRVERALRRVRAVVHQARPARPRSSGSTSRSTSTRAAASTQIAGWEAERARLEARRRDRGAAELRVRGDDHPQHRDRQAARRSTATSRTTA